MKTFDENPDKKNLRIFMVLIPLVPFLLAIAIGYFHFFAFDKKNAVHQNETVIEKEVSGQQ
jgi:flagellar basal body-associated protein FliL